MSPVTFIHLEEVDSTNTYLKNLPRDPDQPVVAVRADYQTAGRGQRGNTWHSARGQNLLCSIRHHPTFLPPERQFVLSQLISLALVDGLSELLPDEVERFHIKWPNDIYWCDRKLCGILIEYELSTTAIEQAIIGFGLNVLQTDFGKGTNDTTLKLPNRNVVGASYNPVSLQQIVETGEPTIHRSILDVPTLFHLFVSRYVDALDHFQADPSTWSAINNAYTRRLYRLDIPARFRDASGDFEAVIDGVNADGTLRLRSSDGTLRHYAFKEVAYLQ